MLRELCQAKAEEAHSRLNRFSKHEGVFGLDFDMASTPATRETTSRPFGDSAPGVGLIPASQLRHETSSTRGLAASLIASRIFGVFAVAPSGNATQRPLTSSEAICLHGPKKINDHVR